MSLAKAWSLTVVLVAAIAPRGTFVQAARSNAKCISSFGWMNNTLNQTPCLVGSYLMSECFNGTIIVDALQSTSSYYAGSSLNGANNCVCSTVTYSMLSACGICQNATAESWSAWSIDCSESLKHYSKFPMDIPNGTAVPHWAYLDVETDDKFNPTAAQRARDFLEATSTRVQFASSSISSMTSVSAHPTIISPIATANKSSTAQSTSKSSVISSMTSVSANSTVTSPKATAKKSSTAQSAPGGSNLNVGAIVGGVVGGIAGITIVGVAAWFLVRRSRSMTAQRSAALRSGAGPEIFSMTQQFRLYDPSDPSTFPTSSPFGVIPSTSSMVHNVYQRPPTPSHIYSEQSRSVGMYTGAPEL